jgi:hypothetical protein
MPPKKRPTTSEEPAAKRADTEQNKTNPVPELTADNSALADAITEQVLAAVRATVPPLPRTLDMVVINDDSENNYRIVESDWFPEVFNRLWGRELNFFMPDGLDSDEEKDWLDIIRLLYGRSEHKSNSNILYSVTDMAERKRILADKEACKKFFAERGTKLDDFILYDLTDDDMHKPTPGPSCKIIVRYD